MQSQCALGGAAWAAPLGRAAWEGASLELQIHAQAMLSSKFSACNNIFGELAVHEGIANYKLWHAAHYGP